MKSWIWLRVEAVVLGLFAVGHTLGTAVPRVTRGAAQAAVLDTMQRYRFSMMGFDRSYWDTYRGFALTVSLLMAATAAIAWQTAAVARRDPRSAIPLAITLELAAAGLLVLSIVFFFTAPIAFSALALASQSMALVALARER